MPTNLKDIQHEILTQDNLITANPIFIVQQRNRIYGLEEGYEDGWVWVEEGEGEVTEADIAEYKAECKEMGWKCNRKYKKIRYRDVWDFVTACFTRKACEDYLNINGHNLHSPRIYVESGYRNYEWEFLREFLSKVEIGTIDSVGGT